MVNVLSHSIESSSSSESSIGITTDPQYYHPAHPGQSPVYAQEEQNNNHNGRQIEYPYTPYEEGNLQAPLIRERRHRSPEETRNGSKVWCHLSTHVVVHAYNCPSL